MFEALWGEPGGVEFAALWGESSGFESLWGSPVEFEWSPASVTTPTDLLTWGGVPLTWGGDRITWG